MKYGTFVSYCLNGNNTSKTNKKERKRKNKDKNMLQYRRNETSETTNMECYVKKIKKCYISVSYY